MEQTSTSLDVIIKAEIDQQIATAKAYPRDASKVVSRSIALACMNDEIAEDCIYTLPRKDKDGSTKNITGPSIRFAEMMAHSWGNSISGGRIISVGSEVITAQGVFYDLEANVKTMKEVGRKIMGSSGKRYSADMINVTGNAAISIACRNAIVSGIPKAYWQAVYEAVTKKITGDGDKKTLKERIERAVLVFQKIGVDEPRLLSYFEVKSRSDFTEKHLLEMTGLRSALKENETTIDALFAAKETKKPQAMESQNDQKTEIQGTPKAKG